MLQGYSLTTFARVFEKAFEGTYIKMNNIEQRNAGDVYAIAYQDNGEFSVCVVNNQGTVLDEIDVTAIFDLND